MAASQLRRAAIAVAGIALATLAIVGGFTLADRDESTANAPMAAPTASCCKDSAGLATAKVGLPQNLTIGSIGVNAPIEPVGTTADGAQEVPASIDDTGWWSDGVQPGRAGNAVIVGHTASSAAGVFDDLGKLRRGEALTVRSAHGTLRYDVTRVTSVKVSDFDRISALVYRSSGRPGLVLMTCGDWNGRRYESTTIVFSTLASD